MDDFNLKTLFILAPGMAYDFTNTHTPPAFKSISLTFAYNLLEAALSLFIYKYGNNCSKNMG